MDRIENNPEYLTPGWSEKTTFVRVRETVADGLARAAHALHEKSSQAEEESELANLGIRAADWLERSADYVKVIEPQQLRSDFEDQVRRHPGRSLLIAGIAGLILGRVFRRR
ncbi:MAG: hypothetical protein L0220_17275 [Acidobacteria bacterium]|nr:hypothetical protein [Acidobacteriota bacterium]